MILKRKSAQVTHALRDPEIDSFLAESLREEAQAKETRKHFEELAKRMKTLRKQNHFSEGVRAAYEAEKRNEGRRR